MPVAEHGSLTKEPPLSRIDAAIRLIQPGMSMADLRTIVSQNAQNQPRESAQHEPDPAIRAALVRSPAEVLFQLGLNGLANLVEADRTKVDAQGGGDFVQEEGDVLLGTMTGTATTPKNWKNREIASPSGGSS